MYRIVAFDISEDRIRAKVAKILESYGVRVQKSVFEIPHMSQREFLRLRSRLEGLVDPSTDSLLYYTLCQSCVARIERWGLGEGILIPDGQQVVRILGGT